MRHARNGRAQWGALCLVLVAGCGGRTSALVGQDTSTNSALPSGSDGDTGGHGGTGGALNSSTSPASAGGTAVVGNGGAVSTPSAGAPSTGGSPSSNGGAPSSGGSSAAAGSAGGTAVAQTCTQFCDQLQNSGCPDSFGPPAVCTNQCAGSLAANDACTPLGKAVLDCYAPIFKANAGHCSSIEADAITTCAVQLKAFQSCTGAATLDPTQMMGAGCASSGSVSAATCNVSTSCGDGSFYVVNCVQSTRNHSVCTCSSTTGLNTKFVLNEALDVACVDGSAMCGVPTLPK